MQRSTSHLINKKTAGPQGRILTFRQVPILAAVDHYEVGGPVLARPRHCRREHLTGGRGFVTLADACTIIYHGHFNMKNLRTDFVLKRRGWFNGAPAFQIILRWKGKGSKLGLS